MCGGQLTRYLWLLWLLWQLRRVQCSSMATQCSAKCLLLLVVKWLDRFNSPEGFTAHRWVSTKLGFPKNSSHPIYTSRISFASFFTCQIFREVVKKYADMGGGWGGGINPDVQQLYFFLDDSPFPNFDCFVAEGWSSMTLAFTGCQINPSLAPSPGFYSESRRIPLVFATRT